MTSVIVQRAVGFSCLQKSIEAEREEDQFFLLENLAKRKKKKKEQLSVFLPKYSSPKPDVREMKVDSGGSGRGSAAFPGGMMYGGALAGA